MRKRRAGLGRRPKSKSVVKRPAQNKFVLRTAARGASFLQGGPQGAACKVRPAGSFSAMRKRRAGLGCNPKSKSSGASFLQKRLAKCGPQGAACKVSPTPKLARTVDEARFFVQRFYRGGCRIDGPSAASKGGFG